MSDDQHKSLQPAFFDQMYSDTHDPWGFETRPYEAEKYAETLASVPRTKYRSAFEIGCSVGVLTQQLATRCDELLAVDVIEKPLEHARTRCRHLPHVRFERMQVPEEFPEASFDLIVLSEVAYYWAGEDLQRARDLIIEHLDPGGNLVMVHWRPFVEEYPRTGDEVHELFISSTEQSLRHLSDRRQDLYRLDVFERR
jgi:trans-aconitate methyltransferase